MNRLSLPQALLAAAVVSTLTACSSDSAGPANSARVAFSVSTVAPGGTPGLAFASDTLVGAGPDTLVLDSVRMVLRDIRFERAEDSSCDDDQGDDQGDNHSASIHDDGEVDDNGHDDDACESYNAGPFLLDLPLGPGVERAFSVPVDTGTFDELRIRIHKPEDNGDPRDAAFLADHPEFSGVSIRAFGSFNGSPFEYTTDLSAEQRMNLVPPIVVAAALSQVDVTIKVDLTGWFADGLGGLVDPASANAGGLNQNLVEDNIKSSFHAFRDEDHDGHDDDGNDDD
jgi:hypothetical protein